MSTNLFPMFLLVAVLAALPWALRKFQRRTPAGALTAETAPKIVADLGIGQHQRVVTLELGEPDQRRWLVLGVTNQHIQCLHEMAAPHTSATLVNVPSYAAIQAEANGNLS